MLVLQRKTGETLVIGDGENQAVVTINRISGGRVTIGIEAHASVKVMRGELERYDDHRYEPAPAPAAPLAAFVNQ